MIRDIPVSEVLSYKKDFSAEAVIIDLTVKDKIAFYPFHESFSSCKCAENFNEEVVTHCPRCGATIFNNSLLYPTFDYYSAVYKLIDLLSAKAKTIVVISDLFIPSDFVGSLNLYRYLYVDNLPIRRNILYINNGVFSLDEVSLLEHSKRENLTYIAMFSDNKDIKSSLSSNISHYCTMPAKEYINLLLGNCGITNCFNILCSL